MPAVCMCARSTTPPPSQEMERKWICPPRTFALEQDDLEELCRLLDAGWDVHEEFDGFTLLHAAVDGEIDGHAQTGKPLHVDATALLLSKGADPLRPSHGGKGTFRPPYGIREWPLVGLRSLRGVD